MTINAVNNVSTAVSPQVAAKKVTNDGDKDNNVRSAVSSHNTTSDKDNDDKNIKKVVETQKQESKPAVAVKSDSVKLSSSAQARRLKQQGLTAAQIALKLGISVQAVNNYIGPATGAANTATTQGK